MVFTLSAIGIVYIVLNLYVTKKINKASYLNEERRALHKNLIWFIPFIGPLMINGFWRKDKKVEFETMTKDQREKKKGDFHESGIGLNS
jgi:hypothetical protein